MTEHHPNEQTPLITPALVALDAAPGAHRRDVIKFLARKIGDSGRADDANGLAGDALAREATAPTGIPGGMAIPHCRSAHVLTASLGFARLAEPVDFGADDDRPADIVFMIAAPDGANDVHLQLLAKLARGLMDDAFTGARRSPASSPDRFSPSCSKRLRSRPKARPQARPWGRQRARPRRPRRAPQPRRRPRPARPPRQSPRPPRPPQSRENGKSQRAAGKPLGPKRR